MRFEKKITYEINRMRETYGVSYPRNSAERKSLLHWIYIDVCHQFLSLEECNKIMTNVIGDVII